VFAVLSSVVPASPFAALPSNSAAGKPAAIACVRVAAGSALKLPAEFPLAGTIP
jgi:hypothetical protein